MLTHHGASKIGALGSWLNVEKNGPDVMAAHPAKGADIVK